MMHNAGWFGIGGAWFSWSILALIVVALILMWGLGRRRARGRR